MTKVKLTAMTCPQTMRLTFLVMFVAKSTRAGRSLGNPDSTNIWGLKKGTGYYMHRLGKLTYHRSYYIELSTCTLPIKH